MNWLYFGIVILLDLWKMAFVTNHTGISLEHDCITRLVSQAGKYIAKDHYCIMKKLGSLKLKRHTTRHVSEVTAIASKFGNSAKIIVPCSWLRK